MVNIRTVSTLGEVNGVLQEMGINAIDQAGQVQFLLHEQASIQEAARMKARTRPGRHGFRLLNFELLDCKLEAKVELDTYFNAMLDACMAQCDQELLPLEARIAELKVLMLSTDQQIPHVGPDIEHRNRGVQQMLYPCPPFPVHPSYEFGTTMEERVPYQDAYTTDAERSAAVSRDKRAQRAVWNANLRLLEVKKSVLEKKKGELLTSLWEEFRKMSDEESDLGVGYANYEYPHLA